MARYGTVYIEIEAVQWTGDNAEEIREFTNHGWESGVGVDTVVWDGLQGGWIPVNDRDYIIKGTEGEFYPCAETVFNRKYVLLSENPHTHRLIVQGDGGEAGEQ